MHTHLQDKYPLIMKWDTKLAILLMAILVIVSLTGCGNVPAIDRVLESQQQHEQTEQENSIGVPNFQGIADALGCVFAPQSCKNN